MISKKSLKVNSLLKLLLAFILFPYLNYAQHATPQNFNFSNSDTSSEKPVQYRRGIELQKGYQTYEQKYFGKNLSEEKRRLFPLESTGIWTELNPKVPRVDYLGIHFVDEDTGWACGGSGAIIKTMDGGKTWTISETPINNLLLKIHSYNGQIVIATGYDGIILRSSDGGETFEQMVSGVGSGIDLWGLQMLNDTLGWACGMNQTLLKTTDAGLTWQPVNPGLNQHYWSLDFLNEQYGMIACGNGIVLKTTNGGNSWTQIQAGDTRALFTIDIIDSLHIAAAGAGAGAGSKNIYSSDGGNTWIQNTNLIYENGVNCIAFINTETGYAVGEQWVIRKTTNRGVDWFASGPVSSEWWLKLLQGGAGYAAGNALRIYKTENGYDNWEKLFFTDNFSDVFFLDENNGFIIVSEPPKLYKTSDGGLTWDSIQGAPGGVELLFLDNLTGFIGSNLIYKTTDGGVSWYSAQGSGATTKIFFINSQTGWAIGGRYIYKTTDAGENWMTQQTVPNGSFSSIYFVDSLYGWATIFGRRPYKTIDGGTTWIEQTNLDYFLTRDVNFNDYTTGWLIRDIGGNNLFKTIDSGVSWYTVSEVFNAFRFHYFPDSQHWLINGGNRYITEDGGNMFIDITNDVPTGFGSFEAATDKLGYAAGVIGLILRYNDTSYVPVELINFSVEYSTHKINLHWVTTTETNNYGFEILRSENLESWNNIGFVKGQGTTTERYDYSFIDDRIYGYKIYYKLKQIDFDGSFNFSEIITVELPLKNFALSQNYPNPANPITNISFTIPQRSFVMINLYSVNGELVKQLIEEEKEKGIYKLQIDLSSLPSGVYFYRMITNSGYQSTKKLLILK